MKKLIPLLISAIVLGIVPTNAQSYKVVNDSSKISVLGTSTLHDWKINADKIEGSATLVKKGETLTGISSLKLNVPIADMNSGLDAMDEHMRTAMTANGTNSVMVELIKVDNISPNTIGGYTIQAEAKITIVGNSKNVKLQVTMDQKNGNIRFFGETQMDMSTYGVAPPSAEMGSIKTEKDVKVVFDVTMGEI